MYGPQATTRFFEQGVFLLQAFHNEFGKDPMGRETEFWRGNLACWREMAQDLFPDKAEELIARVKLATNLPIPHRGPLSQGGQGYLGWDSGADF